MKKILLSVVSVLVSANLFAITFTDNVTITLKGDVGSAMRQLTVGESEDLLDGVLQDGYYTATGDLTTWPLAIYAIFSSTNYNKLQMKSMVNTPIGIKTNDNTGYQFSFSGIQGSKEVQIYDVVADSVIHVNVAHLPEMKYHFTISGGQKNSYINDRFILFYEVPELDVCFRDNKIQINSNPYSGTIRVTDPSGNPIAGSPFASGTTLIDLSGAAFAKGCYTIVFGGEYKYVVIKD